MKYMPTYNEEKMINIHLKPLGFGAFTHDLQCWICDERPAVYSAYPDFCFLPCWYCQETNKGIWTKKTFWQKLFS